MRTLSPSRRLRQVAAALALCLPAATLAQPTAATPSMPPAARPPAGAARANAPAAAATVVLLMRHAEKAAEPAADPPLTEAGTARAQRLAEAAREAGVRAVYSTQYRRTLDTARPLAAAVGVPVAERPITAANAGGYALELAREIRARHAGQTVAVVGHSNTIPAVVAALTGGAAPTITDDQYGDLFVVVLDGAAAPAPPRVLRVRVGS
jgi:broad specificity phosphatase PhoE